jgi:hypothetical protein
MKTICTLPSAGGGLVYNKKWRGIIHFQERTEMGLPKGGNRKRRRYRGHLNARSRGRNGVQPESLKTAKNLSRFQAQRRLHKLKNHSLV